MSDEDNSYFMVDGVLHVAFFPLDDIPAKSQSIRQQSLFCVTKYQPPLSVWRFSGVDASSIDADVIRAAPVAIFFNVNTWEFGRKCQ